jgi:hypothetical protein
VKVVAQRRHVIRPENYESVELLARIEIDSDNAEDAEYFKGDLKQTGELLSEDMDNLLDTDVDRTLRLDGQHINDTHLWVFYGRD